MPATSAIPPQATDTGNGDGDGQKPFDPEQHYIVRGRILLRVGDVENPLEAGQASFLMGNASGNTTIQAAVAAAVRFNLDTANFTEPTDPEEGEISYGTLDIDRLRDNDLRVCGPNNDEKCTVGVIPTYTT
mgnify:FL=1